MKRLTLLTSVGVVLLPLGGVAQTADIGARLLEDATVRAAMQAAMDDESQTVGDQVRLCEIAAPPFEEANRAQAYAAAMKSVGLRNVRIDKAGNVLGERRGLAPRPHLVFSAHLDTIFPAGTDVKVARNGNVLKGAGIGDDCRGLAVVLAVARALERARVKTPGTITFVGTVGEEGLGNLRGVKALFADTLAGRVDRFVSVDGGGILMTNAGVGSRRYRVTFAGPGGHSYGGFGAASPIHALGRAITAIARLEVPLTPRTTFNVGRVGGGVSVNAIPPDAWMELDLRSEDHQALEALVADVHRVVDQALAEENRARNHEGALTVEKTLIGARPSGRTAPESPMVVTAVSVTRALNLPVILSEGSTDANVPMSLGIPAMTIEGGGRGSGTHSMRETFDTTNSWQGTQRATLLAIALTQP